MKHRRNYHLRTERWRDVKGYEGLYQVSNKGRVKSLERVVVDKNNKPRLRKSLILAISKNDRGYCQTNLYKNGVLKTFRINRLVAQAFIPNPDNKPYVDHINTIRDDNQVENLRWVTPEENNLNDITRQHLSEMQTGKKNHQYGKTGKYNARSIPVLQFDLDGNFIKEWESANEVSKSFNHCNSLVSMCCKGRRKTGYGYIWKYKSDILKENNDTELN